jgi:glycosyltransferase involved in cell wall biosynthesis
MAGPEISVVIPAFERISALEGCLHALAAQTLPPSKFEVIVCDDGSRLPVRDALASTLGVLADRLHVRVIRQDNGGPAAARNRGAGAAVARYLAFTDDDCRPEPDWLERLLRHFATRPEALVGGGLRTTAGSDRYRARRRQSWISFMPIRSGAMACAFSARATSRCRLRIQGLGGFSATFKRAAGEDYDLCGAGTAAAKSRTRRTRLWRTITRSPLVRTGCSISRTDAVCSRSDSVCGEQGSMRSRSLPGSFICGLSLLR